MLFEPPWMSKVSGALVEATTYSSVGHIDNLKHIRTVYLE